MIQNIKTLSGTEYAVHESTPYINIEDRDENFIVTTAYKTEIIVPYHAIEYFERYVK